MIERLARLGYASIGTVYVIAGLLAAAAGLGIGGSTRGQKGAFDFIRHRPFGHTILAIIAIGLLGYALWRFIDGFADSERRGSDAKGIAQRIGSIARGFVYAAMALEVSRLILHHGAGSESSDASAKHWTARVFHQPYGRLIIAAIGLVIVVSGGYQLYKGLSAKFGKRLHFGSMDAALRRKMLIVSRFGIAGRGVIFFVIGCSLVTAALHDDANAARGTSGALRQLAHPFGGALLVAAGLGLAAYGIYAFLNARYRSIRA